MKGVNFQVNNEVMSIPFSDRSTDAHILFGELLLSAVHDGSRESFLEILHTYRGWPTVDETRNESLEGGANTASSSENRESSAVSLNGKVQGGRRTMGGGESFDEEDYDNDFYNSSREFNPGFETDYYNSMQGSLIE